MAERFAIGDLHFYDPNIIAFEQRTFKNVDEMNKTLIEYWNGEVKSQDDIVFVVGDFFDFEHCTENEAVNILKQLKGHIILIAGNHDMGHLDFFRKNAVDVYEFPILVDDFWIMSHEPKYVNLASPYANIFAHVHNNPMFKTVSARSYCVSAERIGYKPIKLRTAFEEVQKLA